jgi:hypothetical protein
MTARRPLAWAPQHRAPLGVHAIRAGYRAHQGAQHGGLVGRGCASCARYLGAIAQAVALFTGQPAAQPTTDREAG